MTISIIGNSHLVALKLADGDFPWACSYFWSSGFNLRDVIVEDGKLVGGTKRLRRLLAEQSIKLGKNVQKEIELKTSSAFIVVGLGLSPMYLARAYNSVRLFNHVGRGMTVVSADCLEEILVAQLRSTTAFKIARLLRENCDKPIVVVPQPAPMETAKTAVFREAQQRRNVKLWQPLFDTDVGEMLMPIYVRALARAADYERLNAVAQPEATLTGAFTRVEYQHAPDDHKHGSKSYGAHVLGALKREIEIIGIEAPVLERSSSDSRSVPERGEVAPVRSSLWSLSAMAASLARMREKKARFLSRPR